MSATAQTRQDRAFAYVALICGDLDDADLEGRSCQDILDAFFEAEQTAADEPGMWPFGWGDRMRRLAPVQITGVWDMRNDLMRLLGSPKFRVDQPAVYGGSIFFFPEPAPLTATPAPASKDLERFLSVITASVEMARRRDLGEGLLFVGGWGWYDGAELPADQQVTLMAAGFPHVDRRVP